MDKTIVHNANSDNNIASNIGSVTVNVNDLSENKFPIIPVAEFNDARSQYETAKILLNELTTFKSTMTAAKTLLTSGDSCTAVDMIITITAQPPKGKLATQFYQEAKKLLQECMLLCAEKLVRVGGYQKRRIKGLEPLSSILTTNRLE